MRASAPASEDDTAAAGLCVNPRSTLLLSAAISPQGSLSALANSSLRANELERAAHRIEREIHFAGLDVERRREAHDSVRI
jgi:hypothetical protein